jgi:glucosylceramidase
MKNRLGLISVSFITLLSCGVCKKSEVSNNNNNNNNNNNTTYGKVENWLTTGNQASLVQKQTDLNFVANASTGFGTIDVDSASSFQSVDGFGYTLTGGSAYLINRMGAAQRTALLNEIFGTSGSNLGVSYLRISIGASDLSENVFSYNDLPAGQTDLSLAQFSLAEDTVDLIPVLKEILTINPNIKIMGSPWSAPSWMKDNGSSIGGSLQPQYYSVYAAYLVKYIQQMQAKGMAVIIQAW